MCSDNDERMLECVCVVTILKRRWNVYVLLRCLGDSETCISLMVRVMRGCWIVYV